MSFVKYPPTNIAEAIDVIEQDSEIFHNIVHGDENTEVLTENGLVPSLSKGLLQLGTETVDRVFPDNSTAVAGGLTVGQFYRTTSGDVKVVY